VSVLVLMFKVPAVTKQLLLWSSPIGMVPGPKVVVVQTQLRVVPIWLQIGGDGWLQNGGDTAQPGSV